MVNSGFWVILAAVGGYGALHSILASHRVKQWAEQAGGLAARRYYRLFFSLAAVLGLLPPLGLAAALPDQRIYAIPFPWLLLTLALQGLAGWGLLAAVRRTGVWAFLGLRQVGDPRPLIPRPESAPELVKDGFYRSVRHPLYSFSFVLLWLLPVMSWNLLALALGLSLYMLVGIWFEERKLVAEHGSVYIEYRKRTKMLIPMVL